MKRRDLLKLYPPFVIDKISLQSGSTVPLLQSVTWKFLYFFTFWGILRPINMKTKNFFDFIFLTGVDRYVCKTFYLTRSLSQVRRESPSKAPPRLLSNKTPMMTAIYLSI